MNPLHTRLLAGLLQSCVVAVPLLAGNAPASAAESVPCGAIFSAHDQLLVAKADESPTALRRYVERTYPIYLTNVEQAREQAARFHQIAAACK